MKKVLSAGLTAFVAIASPLSVFAQAAPPSASLPTTPSTIINVTPPTPAAGIEDQCNDPDQIVEFDIQIERLRAEGDARIAQYRSDVEGKVSQMYVERDSRISMRRVDTDAKRQNDAAQKTARHYKAAKFQLPVQNFLTFVSAALRTRHDAVDAANRAFRDSLNPALQTRRDAVTNAINARRVAIDAAYMNWKSHCGGTKDERQAANKALSQALQAARKASHDAIEAAFQAYDVTVRSGRQTRDAAVKSAWDTTQSAMKDAYAALRGPVADTKGKLVPTVTSPITSTPTPTVSTNASSTQR